MLLTPFKSNIQPMLTFSWEEDFEISMDIIANAIEATKETEILVVIGYSFPFFNREVDRKIIGSMTNLEKVYFQDKYPNDISEKFIAIRPDLKKENKILIGFLDQFFLPHEL